MKDDFGNKPRGRAEVVVRIVNIPVVELRLVVVGVEVQRLGEHLIVVWILRLPIRTTGN